MIGLIAMRELKEFQRDGRLYWTGGIVLVLMLTALLVGWQQQSSANAERSAAQELDYDDWIQQKERHPHDAAHQGMHVFKPEAPLSMVDAGITPYVGSTQWLRAHRQTDVKFVPSQDATGLQRFGNLSVAWVLQVLGPLLVIVLGFNSFAGEREQGTLRQLMSQGVSPYRLLLGKAAALSSALALLFVPVGIVTASIALKSIESELRLDTLLRLLVLFAGYAAYLGIFVFLSLAVSGWASTTRLALIILLALWIVGIALAPRAISDMAARWHPTPSRVEFNNRLGNL
ncbi:MAG: ABC transporter permease [Pseudomonadota bacterium]